MDGVLHILFVVVAGYKFEQNRTFWWGLLLSGSIIM